MTKKDLTLNIEEDVTVEAKKKAAEEDISISQKVEKFLIDWTGYEDDAV